MQLLGTALSCCSSIPRVTSWFPWSSPTPQPHYLADVAGEEDAHVLVLPLQLVGHRGEGARALGALWFLEEQRQAQDSPWGAEGRGAGSGTAGTRLPPPLCALGNQTLTHQNVPRKNGVKGSKQACLERFSLFLFSLCCFPFYSAF